MVITFWFLIREAAFTIVQSCESVVTPSRCAIVSLIFFMIEIRMCVCMYACEKSECSLWRGAGFSVRLLPSLNFIFPNGNGQKPIECGIEFELASCDVFKHYACYNSDTLQNDMIA